MVMEETGAYKEHYEDIRKRTAATAPASIHCYQPFGLRPFFAIVEGREMRRRPQGHERGLNFYGANWPFVSGLRRIGREGLGDQILTN